MDTQKEISDKYYEEMYAEIDAYYKECDRINQRLLTIIKRYKGEEFYDDLMDLLEECNYSNAPFQIVRECHVKEIEVYDYCFSYYVDQYENGGMEGDSFAGFVYIPLKENRFLKFHYSM